MRPGRAINHTRLWGSAYHGFLQHAFGQILSYFSLPQHEHGAPQESSFADALSYLAKVHGFKPMAVLNRFDRLMIKTPSIARHRQTNKPVLLLPTAHVDYAVINDENRQIDTIDIAKISANFDSIIQLFPVNSPEKITFHTSSIARLLYPSLLVFLWSALIAMLLLVFVGASFVGFGDITLDNRFPLLLLVLMSAVLALGALSIVKSLALKNYGLALVLVLHDVFCSLYVFTDREHFIHKYSSSESLLKKYFFDRFKVIIAVLFLVFTVVLAGSADDRFIICVLSSYGILLFASWAAEVKHKQLEQSKDWALDSVNLMLERVQCSLPVAQGLKALPPMIVELEKQHKKYTTVSIAAWYMARLQQISFIMFPLLLLVLFVLLLGGGFIELSLWQAAVSLLLALIAGVLLAYVGQNLAHSGLLQTNDIQQPARHLQPMNIRGTIELINVSFAYKDTGQAIFKSYDLVIEAGTSIAIIGPSGSGKTTLLKIMMGILTPDQGQVIIDGHDIRSLDKHHLRTNFGVVLQGAQLFAGSVFDNIMCGRALPSDSVQDLLLSHEIFDVLLDLPLGLSTYIFDRGKNIAHYERCLILLARALVHKPQLIFIDELLSSLPAREQEVVLNYLSRLKVTCVVTANRPLNSPCVRNQII